MKKLLEMLGITIALTAIGVGVRANIKEKILRERSEKTYKDITRGRKTINQIRRSYGLPTLDNEFADKKYLK